MKVREITIMVDSLEESGKRFVEAYEKIKRGEKIEKQEILSFENIETLRKIITNERLRLLRLIRTEKPKTIYALAKIAKRPYSNVFNDVKKLEELGLIELEASDRNLAPKAKYSRLKIAIPV
ncbi:MAG: MarR family transcriptional regulator [Candidatus Diapherotrites archaeon]